MFTNRKLIVLVVFALVAVFAFGAWSVLAQDTDTPPCDFGQMYGMMAGRSNMVQGRGMGMMGGNVPENCLENGFYGMGMMGGMMGQNRGMGMMGYNYNSGTMGRFGPGAGFMGSWTAPTELAPAGETLTVDEAVAIAEAYIAQWNTETPLELAELMQFDNHFYAVAREVETGIGAFEFLIDPTTGSVYGEPGPNMMWNLSYGMSMGYGFGMFATTPTGAAEMTVSVEQARENAQLVLNDILPETTVDEEADSFYGYYTFHILQGDEIVGMLSVNGFTGQVWLHHWHGEFITMTEHAE